MMVALGATPREAAFPSIKAAVGAGMTPLLAQLSAAGIVQIPGMMSGQILAGADPVIAAKYQIVVLLMISAATTLSVVIICFLAYKKRFSVEGYYLSPALRDDAGGARPPSWQAYGMPTGWCEAVGRRERSRTMEATFAPTG